jgi:hypothetical protein
VRRVRGAWFDIEGLSYRDDMEAKAKPGIQRCAVLLVELLPFDPMQSDLRPSCAVAQFAKPPTLLRSAEWGTLRGDL